MLCPGSSTSTPTRPSAASTIPYLTPKLAQGFTTEVINPDGLAPAPVDPARWARAAGVPPAARGPGAGRVAVVDGRRSTSTRSTRRGPRSRSSPRSATAPCATSCSAEGASTRPRSSWRRCVARSASASTRARGCCRSGSSTCRAPSRRPASSSRSPRRRRGRACRSSRTFATRVTACSRRSRR